MIRIKLGREKRSFKDITVKRQEIKKLTREIDESGGIKIIKAQKVVKTRYLKEDQKNTKYFFNLNKKKCDPTIITGLINMSDKLIRDTKTMCKIALEYHRELQSSPKRKKDSVQKIDVFLGVVIQPIEDDDIQMLKRDTNETE